MFASASVASLTRQAAFSALSSSRSRAARTFSASTCRSRDERDARSPSTAGKSQPKIDEEPPATSFTPSFPSPSAPPSWASSSSSPFSSTSSTPEPYRSLQAEPAAGPRSVVLEINDEATSLAPASPKAKDIYLPPVLRPSLQPSLNQQPDHPWWSLSSKDQWRKNSERDEPLPDFPSPISLPAYPSPILPPSAPLPPGSAPVVRYRDLPPEQLHQIYKARILDRPKVDRPNTVVQRFYDMWMAEPDDPEGWYRVPDKLGLPPERNDRPGGILWQWESLDEEQLWRIAVPMFWVWMLVPLLGGGGIYAFAVLYDGEWEDPKYRNEI